QPAARKFLEDHGKGGVVDVRAAVFFGDVEAEQAHLPHFGDERVRVFVAMLHGGGDGDHFFGDELPDGGNDEVLFCGQLSHGGSPGGWHGTTILRCMLRIASPRWLRPWVSRVTMPR